MAPNDVVGQLADDRVTKTLVETLCIGLNEDAQMNTLGVSRKIRISANAMSALPSPLPRRVVAYADALDVPTDAPCMTRTIKPTTRGSASVLGSSATYASRAGSQTIR